MADTRFWVILATLFVVAAAMNFARGAARDDDKKRVNFTLGAASLLFAVAAVLIRFAGPIPGYTACVLAVATWILAAVIAPRRR